MLTNIQGAGGRQKRLRGEIPVEVSDLAPYQPSHLYQEWHKHQSNMTWAARLCKAVLTVYVVCILCYVNQTLLSPITNTVLYKVFCPPVVNVHYTMSQQHSLSVNIVHHRFQHFLRSAVYLISGILQNKTPHPHPYPPNIKIILSSCIYQQK